MKETKFSLSTVMAVVVLVAIASYCVCLVVHTKNDVTSEADVDLDFQETYQQCFNEMGLQSWGLNLFYCEDLDTPVFRTVSDKNWNLLNDAGILNFTSKTSGSLELVPCLLSEDSRITDFCYLLAGTNVTLAETPPADDADWIKISTNSNGNYSLPLGESSESSIVIKYSVNSEIFYGILNVVYLPEMK